MITQFLLIFCVWYGLLTQNAHATTEHEANQNMQFLRRQPGRQSFNQHFKVSSATTGLNIIAGDYPLIAHDAGYHEIGRCSIRGGSQRMGLPVAPGVSCVRQKILLP